MKNVVPLLALKLHRYPVNRARFAVTVEDFKQLFEWSHAKF